MNMSLGPIRNDFQALSEDNYDDMMMEAEEEDMLAVKVEISDEATSEDESVNNKEDVQMVLFGENDHEMGQRGYVAG